MSQKTGRFRLSDLMIVVASTAFGISWVIGANQIEHLALAPTPSTPFSHDFVRYMDAVAGILAPVVLSLSAGLVLAVLLRSPLSRDRFLRPGVSCCLASTFTCGEIFLRKFYYVKYMILSCNFHNDWDMYLQGATINVAWEGSIVVLAVWSLLLIAGRWKPEGSWVDWLGIIFGFFWILLLFDPIR